MIDILLASAALPFAALLIIPLSAVSALSFRCNPFFRQQRHGLHEEPFTVVKIRSLPPTFPNNHGKHDLADRQWDGWTKILRKSHLDELPQLLNILRGSMSIVGPRPMIDEVVKTLQPLDRQKRAWVKPGLTGAWQISTMGELPLHSHPELDNAYATQCRFSVDARIIALTVGTLIRGTKMEPEALLKTLRW